MKQSILFSAFLIWSFSLAFGQVPNGSLEMWQMDTLSIEPNEWATTNYYYYIEGARDLQTERSLDAHGGLYSLKMETQFFDGGDVITAVMLTGETGMLMDESLVSFTQHASGLSVWMKYDIPAGDTAWVLTMLERDDSVLIEDEFPITGTSSSWTEKTFSLSSYSGLPDSAIVFITSGNFGDAITGGWVMIDDVKFTGPGVTDSLPNAGFEDWTALVTEEPLWWETTNKMNILWDGDGITRSTDATDGTYSMLIENNAIVPLGDTMSYAFLGEQVPPLEIKGVPVSGFPSKLTFDYKYTPFGSDSGMVYVYMSKWNSGSGTRDTLVDSVALLPPVPIYSNFEMDLSLTGGPDTLVLAFVSTNPESDGGGEIGSLLWVDNIQMPGLTGKDKPLLVPEPLVKVWPVPASDHLNIDLSEFPGDPYSVKILDPKGKVVISVNSESHGQTRLNVAKLPSGHYFYLIEGKGINYAGKFLILKE